MSNGTHLANFTGHKTEWSQYVTIGNLSSTICHIPSTQTDIIVTLLLSTITDCNDTKKWLDEQRQTNSEELKEVLHQVHLPITDKHHPRFKSRYCKGHFTHCNFWGWKLVIAVLIADCSEYSDVHLFEWRSYICCESPLNKHEDYVPPDKQCPRQDHNHDSMHGNTYNKPRHGNFSSGNVHWEFTTFQLIHCNVTNRPKPDFLTTMLI